MTSLPSAIRAVGEPAPLQVGAVRADRHKQAWTGREPLIDSGQSYLDMVERANSRYGRAKLAPHVGGTPMRGYGKKGESSGISKEEKEELLAKNEESKLDKAANTLGKASDVLDSGSKIASSLAGANPVTTGIKAGTEALKALGQVASDIGDTVDQGRKTTHQINRENGVLAKELEKNRLEQANLMNKTIRDMKHNRYWDFDDFVPSKLKLRNFGFKRAEETLGKWITPAGEAKLNKADEALEAYVKDKFKKNPTAEEQQTQLENLKIRKEMAQLRKEAKELGLDLEGSGPPSKMMSGCGPMAHARSIRAIYPNPDMMSGMMSK